VAVLIEAGVARRVAGSDDLGRFELAEDLLGHHHHHLVCRTCGQVSDLRALAEAALRVASDTGFDVIEHRVDLVGLCANCRQPSRGQVARLGSG
jgi:Fe2+ or Zn2+ uptake regulation protein